LFAVPGRDEVANREAEKAEGAVRKPATSADSASLANPVGDEMNRFKEAYPKQFGGG